MNFTIVVIVYQKVMDLNKSLILLCNMNDALNCVENEG